MDEVLERITDQEKDIAFVGTTVVQTEQHMRDLEMLDAHAQVTQHAHSYSFEMWVEGSGRAEQNALTT